MRHWLELYFYSVVNTDDAMRPTFIPEAFY